MSNGGEGGPQEADDNVEYVDEGVPGGESNESTGGT